MGKYSFVSKERRAQIQEKKRAAHGDPISRKLKQKPQPTSVSGKRKRKLFKKWRREQKQAIQKGLVTMEDVEMAVAEGTSTVTTEKPSKKFHLKKRSRFRMKKSKGKGEKVGTPAAPAPAPAADPVDAMVE